MSARKDFRVIVVEKAVPSDIAVIAELMAEVEAYYGSTTATIDATQIEAALFGDKPAATVLLAHRGDQILGMASYSYLWPAAGSETSLYLKELFVRENARRQGVATALMDALRNEAALAGCSRIEWTADRDNPQALAFYTAYGAEPQEKKVFYRLPAVGDAHHVVGSASRR